MKMRDDGGQAERQREYNRIIEKVEALNNELHIEKNIIDNIELKKMINHEKMEIGRLYLVLGVIGLIFLVCYIKRINSSVSGCIFAMALSFTIAVWKMSIYKFFKPFYTEILWKAEERGKSVMKDNLEKEVKVHKKRVEDIQKEIDLLNKSLLDYDHYDIL
ncbi:MAG: hypothetical protein J6O17_02240 [Eubacterium sp.]|nr:hypothetical protein [Eubacterium sp.]